MTERGGLCRALFRAFSFFFFTILVFLLCVGGWFFVADNLMEGLSQRGIRSVRVGNGSESDLQEEAISGTLPI